MKWILALLLAIPAFAQTVVPYASIALGNANGVATVLSTPSVKVCSVPSSSTAPCNTPATLYAVRADMTCTLNTIPNPFNGDANGNYAFCAIPGAYVVEVSKARYGTSRVPIVSSNTFLLGAACDPGLVQRGTSVSGVPICEAIDKTTVGLDLVDNTSDLGKPISTLAQAAIDLKLNITDYNATSFDPLNGHSAFVQNEYMGIGYYGGYTVPTDGFPFTGEIWRTNVGSGNYSSPALDASMNYDGHPGIFRAQTLTSAAPHLVSQSVGYFSSTQTVSVINASTNTTPWHATWIVNIVGPITNMSVQFGMTDGFTSSTDGIVGNGTSVAFSSAGAPDWVLRKYTGGVMTILDTSAVVATTGWHRFDIVYNGTDVKWYVDTALLFTSNQDETFANKHIGPSFSLYSSDTVAKIVDFDFFSFGFSAITR